ncbi:hypothetical protein LCGC14_0414990 [marine sediment metagenome]|uniref:Peptidase C14 caspase domain-containing protein n=1 Tax=marine sediment metagenome TaxID=412755 RepID=A0A0F9TAL6_9ZZZZ
MIYYLFFFSGHGMRVPDKNEDEYDESWALYDGLLIDDDLFYLFKDFKFGVRIFVISDSYCSGTIIDGFPKAEHKTFPEDIQIRIIKNSKSSIDETKKATLSKRALKEEIKKSNIKHYPNVLLLSACQDNQWAVPGKIYSKFTKQIVTTWNDLGLRGKIKYREFYKQILKSFTPFQSPNYYHIGKSQPWNRPIFS